MPRENLEQKEEQKAKTAYDLIRLRLDRLEQNINRPAPIPPRVDDVVKPKAPPEFVRNVVGSSAAAGSAEFHIFRNNRRKEMERLEYMDKMAKKEEMDLAFESRRKEVQEEEAKRTAKKRAKRLRRKEKLKAKKKKGNEKNDDDESDTDEEDSDEEDSDQAGESGAHDLKTE